MFQQHYHEQAAARSTPTRNHFSSLLISVMLTARMYSSLLPFVWREPIPSRREVMAWPTLASMVTVLWSNWYGRQLLPVRTSRHVVASYWKCVPIETLNRKLPLGKRLSLLSPCEVALCGSLWLSMALCGSLCWRKHCDRCGWYIDCPLGVNIVMVYKYFDLL